MYCEICEADLDVYFDESGFNYIEPCPDCMREAYADGVKLGFKLAGGDMADLAEVMSEHSNSSII